MRTIFFAFMALLTVSCNDNDSTDVIEEGLSAKEISDLQFLKEEEKLARDVYLFSFDLYGNRIFGNISNSEQSHMDRVTEILVKYDIDDLSLPERGKFTNSDLQKLYDDLTALAAKSEEDALVVGATIEDLDINDLRDFIEHTDHQDIEDMYNLLLCGSNNHMRSFSFNLSNLGVGYEPQFISEEEYQEIINGSVEKCMI